MFVTCGIAELDLAGGCMRFSTAACPEVYHFVHNRGEVLSFGLNGYPLGLPFELAEDGFDSRAFAFGAGDVVVFSSDGIEDARNAEQEFYGEGRLKDLLHTCAQRTQSAEDIRDCIVDDVMGFIGDAPQTDDLTVVVLKFCE